MKSPDVFTSLQDAVDNAYAPVISMSYGICEGADLVDLPSERQTAQQANSEGITWLVAAGDAGAADCEDPDAFIAQDGLAVDAPASVPEVTAMGGSEFNEGNGNYWSSINTNERRLGAFLYSRNGLERYRPRQRTGGGRRRNQRFFSEAGLANRAGRSERQLSPCSGSLHRLLARSRRL